MDALTFLSLVAFVALVALFVVVLRRASAVLAETRRAMTFRQEIADIDERLDSDLATLATLVDPLRRPDAQPPDDEIVGTYLAAAQGSVTWARERARTLVPPLGLQESRTVFMDELGRADEALRSLDHGLAILSSGPPEARALEGRTSVKRGFLGIVHVREGLAAESRRVAAWRSAGEGGLLSRRQRGAHHRM
jgi:hypothetical protein